MATVTNDEVDLIRRRMAQLRRGLHQDVQGLVKGAEKVSDWRYYVRLHPWGALGLAMGIGYMIVPRRRRSVTKTAERAAEAAVAKVRETMEPAPKPAEAAARKRGLIGVAIGFLGPVVLRAARTYAAHYVESFILQHGGAAPGSMFGAQDPSQSTGAQGPQSARSNPPINLQRPS